MGHRVVVVVSQLRFPPPFADEDTTENSKAVDGPRVRSVPASLARALMAFGAWSSCSPRLRSTKPTNFAVFFVGLALVHDFVVAPPAPRSSWRPGIRMVTPRLAGGLVLGVLIVLSAVSSPCS